MISSASLFHFTRKLQTLEDIVLGGFKPFYSSEDLKDFGVPECPGIPMVSFCDIPLSRTEQHAREYGSYALGLRKEWGMKRNISPIHYIYPGSMCAKVIGTVYSSLPKGTSLHECGCLVFNPETAIFFYAKPYEGPSTKGAEKKQVRFYDEREWRYIPFADQFGEADSAEFSDIQPMLSEKDYSDNRVRKAKTELLHERYRLRFAANDIKYIIVSQEDEIPYMVDLLSEISGCSDDQRKRLTTRLISMEQIHEDF